MEFVIEKKAFDSAMRQVLLGRKTTPDDLIDLTAEAAMLTVVALGTSVQVPIVCETTGSVSVTAGDIAKLKKISTTYKPGPIRIRIGQGRIRIQNTAFSARVSEKKVARRVIDIPNDAGAMDLLSLPAIFSVDEIEDCGLHSRVLEAQKKLSDRMEFEVSWLSDYGFTRAELITMVEAKLKAHSATMRRVLFPDEASTELPDTGEEPMNEAEMKAELERLRAENAQLKTKDKPGISLKVSEKGALSLYGMGRFPVTLYKEQWLRVLDHSDDIKTFIAENDSKLKAKE
jgi:hypothetical protein